MKISNAVKLYLEYCKSHSKENSVRAYMLVLSKLCDEFEGEDLENITTERVLPFLNLITEGKKQQTKKTRYSHLLAFFNFVKNNLSQDFKNPCDTPMLKKLFRTKSTFHWCRFSLSNDNSVIDLTLIPMILKKWRNGKEHHEANYQGNMEKYKMKTKIVSFKLPVSVFSALRKTPVEFSDEIRLTAAVKWYEAGVVSQEKASEIAGMNREDFLSALSRFNVSPFQYPADEVLQEAGYE